MSLYTCTECTWHGEEPKRLVLYTPGGEPYHLVVCPACRYIASSLQIHDETVDDDTPDPT